MQTPVWFAWNAKEVVRQIYDHTNHQLAVAWVDEIVRDFADTEMPLEVRRLGRTIAKWRTQIVWHRSHVSNGPTEAVNNLEKRVKRVAFGFPQLRPLPDPLAPLRRPTQLDTPRHRHPTLKRGAPHWRS